MLVNLVLQQLGLDFIRLVGDFHISVQAFLRLVQPLHQFSPVFMELRKDKEQIGTRENFECGSN